MEEQKYLEMDRLFVHLNVVQQGAVLALAQGIIMHRSSGRNLTIENARLILKQIGGQALPDTILVSLRTAGWFLGGDDVTFFMPGAEEFVIIKLAQLVLVHLQFQEKQKEDKETTRPRKARYL